MAALSHDLGHPGTNNSFQKKTNSDLYQRFGEKSTLEKYSVYLGWKTIIEHHMLDGVPSNEMLKAEKDFEAIILQTDMAHHTDSLAILNKPASEITKIEFASILLHAADINSPFLRPFQNFLARSNACNDEFYKQGDAERQFKVEVTPFMDRGYDMSQQAKMHPSELQSLQQRLSYKQSLAEIGFVERVAKPFFVQLANRWPPAGQLVENLNANLEELKQLSVELST